MTIIPQIALTENTPTVWYGCYDGGWQNLIKPESMAHPAKYSRNLISRIYSYALERGYLKPGMVVLDCFAGVGLGALDAGANGLSYVGVELESRFHDMGQGCDCTGISKADWIRFYGRWDKMAHKDGNHWCPQCLAEAKQVTDSQQLSFFEPEPSAAYVRGSGIIPSTEPHYYRGNLDLFKKYAKPGTWAVLLNGDSRNLRAVIGQAQVDGVISSPPFEKQLPSHDNFVPPHDTGNRFDTSYKTAYGSTTGQLGSMKPGGFDAALASPPFAGNGGGRGEASRNGIDAALFDRHSGGMKKGTGDNPGNLDHLPMRGLQDALLSSPPYANSFEGQTDKASRADREKKAGVKLGGGQINHARDYGQTTGQLGIEQGTTFWAAARQIVTESYLALKPGAVTFWVTKRFVRDGCIVNFTDQWRQLCEACGFEFVEHIQAMLIQSESEQGDLNGDVIKTKKKKASFFRRLHEKKFPHLAIDNEDVIVMRKPESAR